MVFVALSLLAVVGATKFDGGTPNVLAARVRDATTQNVIISTSNVPVYKAFSFDPANLHDFAQAIKKNTTVSLQPGTEMLFSDMLLNPIHLAGLVPNGEGKRPDVQSVPGDLDKTGKITFDTTAGAPIELGALAGVKWPKTLSINPMYADLLVSVDVKDQSESSFLIALAKASGMSFLRDDSGWYLNPDPIQLRTLLINTVNKLQVEHKSQLTGQQKARVALFVAAIPLISDSDLLKAFGGPTSSAVIDVEPNSDLARAALTYVEALQALEAESPGGQRRPAMGILNRVDNQAKVHLHLAANGEIHLGIPIFVRRGSRATYVNL